MFEKYLLLILIISFSACSTTKLDTSKPVKIKEKAFFEYSYLQNGAIINRSEIIKELGKHPLINDDLSSYKSYFYPSLFLCIAGGAMTGSYIGRNLAGGDMDASILLAGITTAALGLFLSYKAEYKLKKAIMKYNKSTETKKSSFQFYPEIILAPDIATQSFQSKLGVRVTF